MPVDRDHYCQRHEHQKYPNGNTDNKPFTEFRVAVYLLQVLIHFRRANEAGMPTLTKA